MAVKTVEIPVSITHFATDRGGALFIRAEVYSQTERVSRELRVPPPAVPGTSGVDIPYPKGEVLHQDGTRSHLVPWHHIVSGGGPVWERKLIRACNITPVGTNGQNGNVRR